MRVLLKTIIITVLVFISVSYNQDKSSISLELKARNLPFGLFEYIPQDNPIIGLALSGGGARALAQLGVLRALEENGIEVNVIVGTSMGSIVGGLYAAGFSIDDLDSIAINTKWSDLISFKSDLNRRDLFIDQKITDDRALFSLRLDGLKLVLPTSFNDGQKLTNQLYLLTEQAPIHSDSSFNNLQVKFRAVCTDLETGEPVVLDKGQLSTAMRASSSVTFFLEPVKWKDRLLVDGGLLSNIPVDITRNSGADLVIAVNTTSPLHSREKIELPWYIADQVVSIPMKKINEIQSSHADFVITPALGDRASTDFAAIDSLITLGYMAAKPFINAIRNKADSLFIKSIGKDEYYIKNFEFREETEPDLSLLIKKYSQLDSVSTSMLKYDLASLYKSDKYRNIKIDIVKNAGLNNLKFDFQLLPLIKDIKLIGITQIDSLTTGKIISKLKGNRYNGRRIVDVIKKILECYRKQGFLLADFKHLDFDNLTGTLMLYFDEGLISKIRIEGNYTRRTLITRELSIREGEYFTYEKARKSLDNLNSSGFFKDIKMYVVDENNNNTLIINLNEKTSGIIRFGFLADETYNAQFSVDIRDENIFGTGTESGLFLYGGPMNGAFIFELKNNRILDTYLTYNISAYYKFSDIGIYQDNPAKLGNTFSRIKVGEYNQKYYGFSLSVGTQVEKFGNLIFTGKYQVDEIHNTEGEIVNPYKTKLVSLSINTTVDDLDQYPYPLSGLYLFGFYETAQSFLGGNESFTSIGIDLRYFFKLGNLSTIVPRIKIGFGDNTMPLSQQFLLGGMESFMGMRENEFRGRQIFLTSLMYRFKLPFQIFFDTYIKLRYDLGSVWEEQSQIRFKDLRHGIGGIISFDTPIGPAEFALGKSFLLVRNIPDNPVKWGDLFFYFSIGYRVNIKLSSF